MKEKHLIQLKGGGREKLRDRFSCSEHTLSDALNFNINSRLAREIRLYAVNNCRAPIF